jgi:hypothetical protein
MTRRRSFAVFTYWPLSVFLLLLPTRFQAAPQLIDDGGPAIGWTNWL